MNARTERWGFTLIELLVVIAIISILLAMLLPAIQKVREAANRMRCGSNLKQIGIALHNYENSYGVYPPAGYYPAGGTSVSWSAQARLLPFIEKDNVHKLIDFSLPYSAQPNVTQVKVELFICPSEPNARARIGGAVTNFPLNYGVNLGTWFVFDPTTGLSGDGAFTVNWDRPYGSLAPRDFFDGTSNTMALAEVKAYTPYLRDGGTPGTVGAPPPTAPTAIAGLGGQFQTDSGHTEWVDARVHQTGITTVFTPNTFVPYSSGGLTYDVDFNSNREGRTTTMPTYAAVTSRSYHPGGVNILLMDGSVRRVRSGMKQNTWQALGSRNGGEVSADS